MPLQWTTIDLPWAGGIDAKRHPYLRELPKAQTLVNLRFEQTGALVNRDGYTNIGGPAQDPYALAPWSNTLLHANDAGVWRLDQPSGNWRELETPGPRAVDVAKQSIVRNERGCRVAFSAAQNGHVVHVWSRTFETDGDVWCRVDNAETGATVYGPVVLSGITTAISGVAVSSVASRDVLQAVSHENQYVSVFARDAVGGTLAASITMSISAAGAVVLGSAVAHTGVGETLIVDAVANNSIVVGVASTERVHRFTRSGLALSLQSTCVASGLGTPIGICYATNSSRAIALGLDGSDMTYVSVSVASSLPATATPIDFYTLAAEDEAPYLAVGVELTSDGEGAFFVQSVSGPTDPNPPTQLRWVGFDDAGDCYTATDWRMYHVAIAAWPWRSAENVAVVPLTAPLTTLSQPLSDWTPFRRSGTFAELERPGSANDSSYLRRIGTFGVDYLREMETRRRSHSYETAGKRIFGALTETVLGAGQGYYEGSTPTYQADYWSTQESKPVWSGESNGAALLASGLLATVDGIRHAESMQMPPPVLEVVQRDGWSPGGGSGGFPSLEVATGTWAVRACWMWRDNQGVVHRSAPSEALEFFPEADAGPPSGSTSSIASVRAAVPPFAEWRADGALGLALPTDVYLEFYTSPEAPLLPSPNVIAVDDVYQRIVVGTGYTSSPTIAQPILTSERRISPLVDIIDATDPAWTIPLTVIGGATGTSANADDYFDLPLYTNGGVLENDPTPNPLHATTTRERVWVIDSEDRFSVWYSKRVQPAVGAEFSGLQTLRVPTEAGELVALGSVDDLVLFFSESSIYALDTADTGPDATGFGDWPPLRRISREVGCVNAASVVTTDVGCFFASAAGIYLVQSTGQLTWAGRDLADTLDPETIVSAHVVSERREVTFATSTGLYVFDYDHSQWTIIGWTDTDRPTASGAVLRASAEYEGESVVAASGGIVWQEDSASQERVLYQVRTGWIHLAGLQGFQRIRRFGLLGRIGFEPALPPVFEAPPNLGTLTIRVFYDYDDTSFDDYSIDLFDVLSQLDPMRLRMRLACQQCESISFRVTVNATAIGDQQLYSPRPELAGLALEVGAKKRLYPWAHALGSTSTGSGDGGHGHGPGPGPGPGGG